MFAACIGFRPKSMFDNLIIDLILKYITINHKYAIAFVYVNIFLFLFSYFFLQNKKTQNSCVPNVA
jgi:uncharacterized membrane-anchored protein YitT (DUF2179 family)